MFAVLYRAALNAKTGAFRWVSHGGISAGIWWLIASAGFAIYLANYNETHGNLGSVLAFLVWDHQHRILLGAELDAERERGRAMAAGAGPVRRTVPAGSYRRPR